MEKTFKDNLNNSEKLIYMKALAFAANLGLKSPHTNKFVAEQADRIGFSLEKLKNLKKAKRPETISNELLKIKDLKLRRYFVREMVMLAIADHELSDMEMCNMYKIGVALGIKEDKMNDFFLWAAQGIEWQLEGVRLVEDDL
ncbi:MAG: hypothetical protein E7018_01900 [Alphaproteobacteria bacterium]|nr:hypothetical protein [Alphaproteobacteria bacterium]